jgi:hypothetical protein
MESGGRDVMTGVGVDVDEALCSVAAEKLGRLENAVDSE